MSGIFRGTYILWWHSGFVPLLYAMEPVSSRFHASLQFSAMSRSAVNPFHLRPAPPGARPLPLLLLLLASTAVTRIVPARFSFIKAELESTPSRTDRRETHRTAPAGPTAEQQQSGGEQRRPWAANAPTGKQLVRGWKHVRLTAAIAPRIRVHAAWTTSAGETVPTDRGNRQGRVRCELDSRLTQQHARGHTNKELARSDNGCLLSSKLFCL